MVLNSGYLTSTNTKNHITISISTNWHRPAFSKRTVPDASSKLMYTAAWPCNQCPPQSATVELGAAIYNDPGVIFEIGESGMNNLLSEYELVVVIGERIIHNSLSSYNSILVTINKPKVIPTPFRCVKLSLTRTADSPK